MRHCISSWAIFTIILIAISKNQETDYADTQNQEVNL